MVDIVRMYIGQMEYRRIIAVDPSLTCSGWALYQIHQSRLAAIGKLKSLPASLPLSERLKDLQGKIKSILTGLELDNRDILICESQTTMIDPKAAIKVEQVRGIFETTARELGIDVPGRINPRTVHVELLGLSGKQLKRSIVKEMAANTVLRLHKKSLERLGFNPDLTNLDKNQDIVDAILLGELALTKIKQAKRTLAPLSSFLS